MCVVSMLSWPSQRAITAMSIPACSKCIAQVCRLCLQRHSRHTAAMEMLQAGIDRSMISIWLGHESIETTQIYLDANLAIKDEILAKTDPVRSTSFRYRPGDRLLNFLSNL